MKMSKTFKGILLGLSLLLAVSAFAANKTSLDLADTTAVGGTQLKAGVYTVKWEGSGPSVELSILKGNKVVATTPAQLVNVDPATKQDSIVATRNEDGTRSLVEIRMSGKKYVLRVGEESGAAQAGEGKSDNNSNRSVR
jgi:hypothetical protein